MTKITDKATPMSRHISGRMLSCDPGTDNFGFSVQHYSGKTCRIIKCGMIDETIKEVKDAKELAADVKKFYSRYLWLLRRSQAGDLAAERYVPRRQGLSNESVNMMIGFMVAAGAAHELETQLFLAATWKLRLKKVLDLEALYAACKPVPDHVVDATFIGMFAAEKSGLFDMDSLRQTRRQQDLCKQIKGAFLDLRTGHRKAQNKERAAIATAKRKVKQARAKAKAQKAGTTRARSRKSR